MDKLKEAIKRNYSKEEIAIIDFIWELAGEEFFFFAKINNIFKYSVEEIYKNLMRAHELLQSYYAKCEEEENRVNALPSDNDEENQTKSDQLEILATRYEMTAQGMDFITGEAKILASIIDNL